MVKKTKVVHLITRLELGGAQGNTIYTVEHLDPSRYETHLWFGPGGFWDNEVRIKLGTQNRIRVFRHLVRSIEPIFDFLIIRKLIQAFKEAKPDILHTHSSKAGIVGRIAARFAGVPIVIHTYHGFGFNNEQTPWTRALFVWLEKLTARWSDVLIFVSQANWNEAKSLSIGKENQYRRIRSGIPLKEYQRIQSSAVRSNAKEKMGLGNSPVVLTIGPFKPQKNLGEFISAIERLKKIHPNLKALVVGDGEQRPQLEKKIQDLGLTNTISLLGWRTDVADVLAAADVFVLTSLWEGLPRSLVEALASGVPSVCYDTDGVRDLLSKGGGFLVPSKDLEGLVTKVDSLLINKELARRLSSEGPALVDKEFDIDQMVREQERLYEDLNVNK